MITENYIKMCEKAEEIQRAWMPKIGDWYVDFEGDVECVSLMGEEIIKSHSKYDIWLLTQEQLQEMAENRWFHIWGYTSNDFYMTASTGNRDSHYICKKIKSMNELWLMYVMKQKYNKVWTGKDWKNEQNPITKRTY